MANCNDYISADDLKTGKQAILHIEHVAKSRDTNGNHALDVTDTIRGQSVTNKTLDGLENLYNQAISQVGYITMDSFEDGATLTLPNQVLRYEATGEYYRWDGGFPKTVPAGSTPESAGGIGLGAWVNVGDATLRSELKSIPYIVDSIEKFQSTSIPILFKNVIVSGKYYYKRSSAEVDGVMNIKIADGSIWSMEYAVAIYASDFCVDTPTLMLAYTTSAKLGCDFIIDKNMTNLIASTDDPVNPGNDAFKSVICCVSNSVIRFIGDGALRLANQNRPQSHIIYIANGVENINIYNPILEGDRLTNTTVGEHGWGLTILQSSNVRIIGGLYTNMFGDGIYIGMKWGTTDGTVPGNIYIEKPIVKQCRRNGISLTSGENVVIVNPEIYNIGDYGGITGAMPKSGIDIEPEADENVPGYTVPRLINCEISNPYINGAYTGLELNIFPNGLVADVIISGNTTLTNVTNRGVTATRVNGNGIGKILIDRVVFKTSPSDFCVFEMLGDDRLFVEIGEIVDETTIAGGDRIIRLLPRTIDPISVGLSRNFKNLVIKKCTSTISTFLVLAGVSLKEYFIDIIVGEVNDPITTSLRYDSNDSGPAQMRGFIGGVYTTNITTIETVSKVVNNTIVCNTLANVGNITVNTTGDFRELTVKKMLNSDTTNSVYVKGITTPAGTLIHSASFSARLVFKNKEGTYTELLQSFGDWTY